MKKALGRQRGATVLLLLLILMMALSSWALSDLQQRHSPQPPTMDAKVLQALQDTRQALLRWASDRLTARERWRCQRNGRDEVLASSPVPLGLLPYPDRRGNDRDYNGRADCPPWHADLSAAAANRYRIGKLPYRGEDTPCESLGLNGNNPENEVPDLICQKTVGLAAWANAAPISSRAPAGLAFAALDIRIPLLTPQGMQREVPWYAASRNVLDDAENDHYPALTIDYLMNHSQGWLTVCDQSGQTLTHDAAFVVMSPGVPLAGQDRSAAAPEIRQYLDTYHRSQQGAMPNDPCQFSTQSNADLDEVFIANQGLSSEFNDELLFVSRQEMASHLAVVEARRWAAFLSRLADQHQGQYPYAANMHGECQNQVLRGYLPFAAVADCAASLSRPANSRGPGSTQYDQIRYSVNAGRDQVQLQFSGCAMQFVLERGQAGRADAFSFTPNHC